MSRVIVKSLPSKLKEEKLRELFSQKGNVTDCALKYTKDGVFRKFAFVGFQTDDEAQAAVKHFNKSFIDTCRIKVEIATDFGDTSKPRAWSKYSAESSAHKKQEEMTNDVTNTSCGEKGKKAKTPGNYDTDVKLGNLKDDQDFKDFLEVHKNRATKAVWSNDVGSTPVNPDHPDHPEKIANISADSDSEQSDRDADELEIPGTKNEFVSSPRKAAIASEKEVSDLDYLKSKMSASRALSDSESENSDEGDPASSNEDDDDDNPEEISEYCPEKSNYKYIVKMRGLPTNVNEVQIREFFKPLIVENIKIPRNAKGKMSFRVASVELRNKKDQEQAMGRNKNFIGQKRIHLHKLKEAVRVPLIQKPRSWEIKKLEEKGEEDESIAESGRLYVRNLSYCCTEENLETTFSKYGPLSEVNLPVDSFTKKVKGFAFITFLIPENAVKAYTELDGHVFQGRMLHILPGKTKIETDEKSSSFKNKKEDKMKKNASSSHNWNSLFIAPNAVADVMADKYGKSKGDILDAESRQSLGVRLALGETQVVAETRDFLMQHGVALDSFSQAAAPRSKTVILVKNLPAKTTTEELNQLFARHGSLSQVILPPSGVTALVEFTEPSEARNAFKSLAYTKFRHVPLYLEWAPMDVFGSESKSTSTESKETEDSKKEVTKGEDSSSDDEPVAETDSTLFVKNLNFETTEQVLEETFVKYGQIRKTTIAKKKDLKHPGQLLSMGYGFLEFMTRVAAQKALKELQHVQVDGHQLELKVSNRTTVQSQQISKQKQDTKKKQKSTKILVKNIPFETKPQEIRELFGVFGELKMVRLPKKMSGTGSHRGFGFVDFLTRPDAKRAFNALCHSTRLYGRRLVLEWADTEDSIENLRRRTADQFTDEPAKKKLKKSSLMENLKGLAD